MLVAHVWIHLLVQGLRVTFEGIKLSVADRADKKTTKQILKGISGYLNPQQVTAIMGPWSVQCGFMKRSGKHSAMSHRAGCLCSSQLIACSSP